MLFAQGIIDIIDERKEICEHTNNANYFNKFFLTLLEAKISEVL